MFILLKFSDIIKLIPPLDYGTTEDTEKNTGEKGRLSFSEVQRTQVIGGILFT